MDWKIALSTFGLIFFAELGDKTQLTTMTLAAQSDTSVWPVFIGAATALTLSALLGVIFGDAITKLVPAQYLHAGAGVAFIALGILLILGKF